MALGISITGEVERRGFLRGMPSPTKLRDLLTEAVSRAIPDPLQSRFLYFDQTGPGMEVTLHPAAEPIYVTFEDDGAVSLFAKTSTVGPGYHATVVDLIAAIGAAGFVNWDRGGHEDDTGYFENSDFGLLQEGMASFLKSLSEAVLGLDAASGIGLSVPEGYRVKTERFAFSTLGFWDREWFERVAMAEGEDLLAISAEFFPWWNYSPDADYWIKGGLVNAWLQLPWTAPEYESEEVLYRQVLDCWERARSLDKNAPTPDDAMHEIQSLLAQTPSARIPDTAGIGFRRHMMVRPLMGDWTIDLPGYFRQHEDADDDTAVYFFGSFFVRGSGLVVEHKNPPEGGLVQAIRESAKERGRPESTFSFEFDGLEGWGYEEPDEEDDAAWCFHAEVASEDRICLVTMTYENPDSDRARAVEFFKSIRLERKPEPG